MKAQIKQSTIPYVPDFLSREEADALMRFVQTITPVRPVIPRSGLLTRKVSYGCYSALPSSRTGKTVHGGGAGWLSNTISTG